MMERIWPSRRIQVGIIAVLALGAAVQVFFPPLTREQRAEKLYTDAWFVGDPVRWQSKQTLAKLRNQSVGKLERALELSPGNSLYEQALV